MRVKKLKLKNGYKRFADLTIDLGEDPKRIIALVGPNGCGKSSVLDGMLFKNNVYNALGNKGAKPAEFHSMNKVSNYNHSNVEIEFNEGNFDEVRAKREAGGKQNTIFSFRSPYRYNSSLKVTHSQATQDISKNNDGATSSSDLDDKMEINYRRLKIAYDKFLNSDPDNNTPTLAKEKIIGDLNKSIENCLELKISSLGNIEDSKGTLYFSKADHKSDFEFDVLSSGEKEVIDILLDLYLRQEEFHSTIFLLDEPELHINTSIQKKLLLEINNLIGTDCQIWVATHSIGFLRALQDDFKNDCQIIEFKDGLNLASSAHILEPIKLTRTNWQRIFNIALDDLTGLLAPENIIFCEGKLNNSLDEKMFNTIFGKKYFNSQFISSTNKSESQKYAGIALTIINKAFSEVSIQVLVDRDDEDIIVPKISKIDVRKLKRREFENYLFDMEIIQKTYPFVTNGEFNAICTNIIDDDIKSKEKTLMAICKETKSKTFQLNLSKNITPETKVYKDLEAIIFK